MIYDKKHHFSTQIVIICPLYNICAVYKGTINKIYIFIYTNLWFFIENVKKNWKNNLVFVKLTSKDGFAGWLM